MFQFTEQLIYFTNKHTYPGDHCNGNYNILRKKFGHMDVNGPNQVKNEFLIFFTFAHLLVSATEKPVTSFSERTGAALFIDVTTETQNLSCQVK